MRLQVFLSHNGVCSRRKAMDLIKNGDVSINGKVIKEPSHEVNIQKDKVALEGQLIRQKNLDYVIMNKPKGYVTTKADKHAEKTVYNILPKKYEHLVPVGRLDRDTEGLLLFTNDGDITYKLTHPKFNIEKTYVGKINGLLDARVKNGIERGVYIGGKRTAPAKLRRLKVANKYSEFQITICEGRKRQIRLMFGRYKLKVTFLKRIKHGPLSLGVLKSGQCRRLSASEVQLLRK